MKTKKQFVTLNLVLALLLTVFLPPMLTAANERGGGFDPDAVYFTGDSFLYEAQEAGWVTFRVRISEGEETEYSLYQLMVFDEYDQIPTLIEGTWDNYTITFLAEQYNVYYLTGSFNLLLADVCVVHDDVPELYANYGVNFDVQQAFPTASDIYYPACHTNFPDREDWESYPYYYASGDRLYMARYSDYCITSASALRSTSPDLFYTGLIVGAPALFFVTGGSTYYVSSAGLFRYTPTYGIVSSSDMYGTELSYTCYLDFASDFRMIPVTGSDLYFLPDYSLYYDANYNILIPSSCPQYCSGGDLRWASGSDFHIVSGDEIYYVSGAELCPVDRWFDIWDGYDYDTPYMTQFTSSDSLYIYECHGDCLTVIDKRTGQRDYYYYDRIYSTQSGLRVVCGRSIYLVSYGDLLYDGMLYEGYPGFNQYGKMFRFTATSCGLYDIEMDVPSQIDVYTEDSQLRGTIYTDGSYYDALSGEYYGYYPYDGRDYPEDEFAGLTFWDGYSYGFWNGYDNGYDNGFWDGFWDGYDYGYGQAILDYLGYDYYYSYNPQGDYDEDFHFVTEGALSSIWMASGETVYLVVRPTVPASSATISIVNDTIYPEVLDEDLHGLENATQYLFFPETGWSTICFDTDDVTVLYSNGEPVRGFETELEINDGVFDTAYTVTSWFERGDYCIIVRDDPEPIRMRVINSDYEVLWEDGTITTYGLDFPHIDVISIVPQYDCVYHITTDTPEQSILIFDSDYSLMYSDSGKTEYTLTLNKDREQFIIFASSQPNITVSCSVGHTLFTVPGVQPTCTTFGMSDYSFCLNCGALISDHEQLAPLGHDIVEHEAQAPTCTEPGWEAYQTCTRCDYTTYGEIVALDHDLIDHPGQAPTCTEPGFNDYQTCSRCDYSTYEEIPAPGHDIVTDEAVEPSCTAPGLTEGSHCSLCDWIAVPQEEIPALGHDFVSGVCTRCGEEDPDWDPNRLTFTPASVSGVAGSSVRIPILISGNTGLANFSLKIDCGEALILKEISMGELPASADGSFAKSVSNSTVTWSGSTNITGDGELLVLTVDISPEAENGSTHTVSVSLLNNSVSALTDENGETVRANFSSGTLTVVSCVIGDLDLDGEITSADSILLIRYLVELETLNEQQLLAADINGDGEITSADSILLIRYLVELDDTLSPAASSPARRGLLMACSVSADTVYTEPGSTVTVPVRIRNNSGFAGFTFDISFPEELTLTDIRKGELLKQAEDGLFTKNTAKGKVNWTAPQDLSEDGVLFELVFTVSETAESGVFPVNVTPTEKKAGNFVDAQACAVTLIPDTGIVSTQPPAAEAKITAAYLQLSTDIHMLYTARIPAGADAPYMTFTYLGREYTVTEYTVNENGEYCFDFGKVNPQCMDEEISATLYATCDGTEYTDTAADYSVRTYCVNLLDKTEDETLRTLLSDILTYGAAAQVYKDYKTDALVTEGLDLTPSTFAAISGKSVSFSGEQDETTCWTGAALVLSNDLATRFTFVTDSTDGLTVEVTIGDRTQVFDTFEAAGDGKYSVTFDGIAATEFDDDVTATFYRNGEQIGAAVSYSVNTYICGTQNSTNEPLAALVKALYNYGASAKAYAAK